MVRSARMGSSRDNGRPGFRSRAAPPPALLASAAALSGVAAALILTDHRLFAGMVALVAAIFLIAGTVRARASGDRPLKFAELVTDRLFDAAILAPLVWVWRARSVQITVLALVGLAASYLASYERARGRSLGYRGNEGVGYRTARAAILVIGLLTGWILAALWTFVALTVSAATIRAWNVVRQERRSPRTFGVPL
jgi:CDP-diacylglycerol---glycerol-3-phosphate 3-phosphatidyltransferase